MKHWHRPTVHRSTFALAALALTVGASALGIQPTPTVHAAAPIVTATVHDNWAGAAMVPPSLGYEFMRRPHYTLHVTGANFVPGATVRFALLRVDTLQVLQRWSTTVEGPYLWVPDAQRTIPNPRAGTFEYKVVVNLTSQAEPLRLWSRSLNRLSMDTVTRA